MFIIPNFFNNFIEYYVFLFSERNFSTGLRGYTTFFILNSAEHEIILLINVKMPTIVGILTFICMINTTSEILKPRNLFVGILVL